MTTNKQAATLQQRLVLSRSLTQTREGQLGLPVSRCHWMRGRARKWPLLVDKSSPAAGQLLTATLLP